MALCPTSQEWHELIETLCGAGQRGHLVRHKYAHWPSPCAWRWRGVFSSAPRTTNTNASPLVSTCVFSRLGKPTAFLLSDTDRLGRPINIIMFIVAITYIHHQSYSGIAETLREEMVLTGQTLPRTVDPDETDPRRRRRRRRLLPTTTSQRLPACFLQWSPDSFYSKSSCTTRIGLYASLSAISPIVALGTAANPASTRLSSMP
jgi:hypothetical protein